MTGVACVTVLAETSPQAVPLGMACVASAIKHDSRTSSLFDVRLFSYSAEDNPDPSSIAREVLSMDGVGFVCFSVFVWNRIILQQAASLIKRQSPSVVCIAGGPEVTAHPLDMVGFDYAVAGEGEISVPSLLHALSENSSPSQIDCGAQTEGFALGCQGVYKLNAGSASSVPALGEDALLGAKGIEPKIHPVVRSMRPDLAKLSSPWLDGTAVPACSSGVLWELARGCPFKCSYCYESRGEKKISYYDMSRIERELDYFASHGVSQVFVLDPTYNAQKKRALEILDLIKRMAPDIFFYFEARAEYIDRQLARAFASIPCSLQFGLQSAHEKVLSGVNRTIDKKLFSRNVGYLNEEGVTFGFDLIYGLPNDTYDLFLASVDYALSLYPNNLEMFCLSVLPGTELYEKATALGLTWQSSPPYHVVETSTCSARDLGRCDKIARAVGMFYNDGKAVPWFNAVVRSLRMKPSAFFRELIKWMDAQGLDFTGDFARIQDIQVKFVSSLCSSRKLNAALPAVTDIITLNGAIGKCTEDGSSSVVSLHYHPDDLMSEYATDIQFFVSNVGRQKCRAKVFSTPNGPDWTTL